MKTYSVDQEEKGYSFVGGNTKYLTKMTQDELAILAKNGDPRVKVTQTTPEISTETAVDSTSELLTAPAEETPVEDSPETKGRKSSKSSAEQGA